MYNPKYDVPLAVGLSLAVSLIVTYVAAGNTLNTEHFSDGSLASVLDVPKSSNTAAIDSGIWLEELSMVHDAYGGFIVNLPQIYDDRNWLLFDRIISKTQVIDTQQTCKAAARCGVNPVYQSSVCSTRSTTGCTEIADTQADGHASLLGYALDGYGIYGLSDSEGNETEGAGSMPGNIRSHPWLSLPCSQRG